MTNAQIIDALKSWHALNDFLRFANEKEAKTLLDYEQSPKGERRTHIALRIYSRYNYARAARERNEIVEKLS